MSSAVINLLCEKLPKWGFGITKFRKKLSLTWIKFLSAIFLPFLMKYKLNNLSCVGLIINVSRIPPMWIKIWLTIKLEVLLFVYRLVSYGDR
jgi:hypothetical protein